MFHPLFLNIYFSFTRNGDLNLPILPFCLPSIHGRADTAFTEMAHTILIKELFGELILKKIFCFAWIIALAFQTLQALPAYPFIGEINVNNSLNVRNEADANSKIIGRLKAGDKVVVLGQKNGFYKLQYPKQLESWMASWLLLGKGAKNEDTIARNEVNVRSGPSMQYPVIARLKQGSKVQVLKMGKDHWVQIGAPSQAYAYVSSKYVKAGESVAVHEKKVQQQKKTKSKYDSALITFQAHLNNKTINETEFQALKAQFESVISLNPNSSEAALSKSHLVKLTEFRSVIRMKELKLEEQQRFKEREQALAAAHKKKMEEMKKLAYEEARKFEFEGWLDDVGGILFRPATHRLKKGDKVLFYLKSSAINLEDFVGKRVGLNGEIHRFRGWGRIIDVQEIEVLHENPSKFWTTE